MFVLGGTGLWAFGDLEAVWPGAASDLLTRARESLAQVAALGRGLVVPQ